jgi:fructose-1,6-bisphosphatase
MSLPMAIFLQAIREVPVALYGSEENTGAILIDPAKPLALAIDPLDGSSNIETNVSIGTIFSILPVTGDPKSTPEQSFLQPGTAQMAAGFFIYGPQLALVLTVGTGTRIFIHSSKYGDFIEAYDSCLFPTMRRNSRSTSRTTGTGKSRSGFTSTIASPAPKARAKRTSTCAGSRRWSPTPTAS